MSRFFAPLTLGMLLALAPGTPLQALDTVTLKSGVQLSGRILAQSRDDVLMEIGSGKLRLPKRTIRRIYEDITTNAPVTRVLANDELPPWWVPLSDLYHSDWVNSLKAVSPDPITEGPFRDVPCLAFRANTIYELKIYGDPNDPAGISMGYHGDIWFHSGDAQKRCRQFLASYLAARDQFEALYRLDRTGGRREASGLVIETSPRARGGALKGWRVTVWNPAKLARAAQPNEAAWRTACERQLAAITRSTTGGRTAWVKYSFENAAKRYLPLERMMER